MVEYGESISIEDVKKVMEKEKVKPSQGVKRKVEEAREKLERFIKSGERIYGVNTGFGKLASQTISRKDAERLQENLVLSHASGVGEPLRKEIVRGAMFIRLHTLSLGYSGIRWEVLELIKEMLNRDIVPFVPSKGSVGASGDLAPSAHMTLVMMGKGRAWVNSRLMEGKKALETKGLKPVKLKEKEGLSLLNGTHFISAVNLYALIECEKLLNIADIALAISIEGAGGNLDAFTISLHRLKRIKGEEEVARNILKMLKGTEIKRKKRIQDPYSFRCAPQVHGAVRELFGFAREKIEKEINAVTDNPVILKNKVISGGNFHGEMMGFVSDIMRMGISEIASISERRIYILLDSNFSSLPSFLVRDPGVNSGFMIPQVVAASLVSENKILSHPCSVDSIPTSGGQEDHVSMGMAGALLLLDVLENAKYILSIEILSGLQAMDMKNGKSSEFIEKIRKKVRKKVKFLDKDREMWKDIENTKQLLEDIWKEWVRYSSS